MLWEAARLSKPDDDDVDDTDQHERHGVTEHRERQKDRFDPLFLNAAVRQVVYVLLQPNLLETIGSGC